jgi:hypothetical protein
LSKDKYCSFLNIFYNELKNGKNLSLRFTIEKPFLQKNPLLGRKAS